MTEFKYFRVVLDDAVDTAGLDVTEGFVDDKSAEEYATLPSTDDFSEAKERENMRWEEILKMLKETGAVDVQSILVTTGDRDDADVTATVIAFTVKYGALQIVWMHDLVTDATGLTVYGPANGGDNDLSIANAPGHTYTDATEALVIERAIATALSQDSFTDPREVFDPTLTGGGAIAFPNQFRNITCAFMGTGGDQATRMADIEGVGAFTVTQLAV